MEKNMDSRINELHQSVDLPQGIIKAGLNEQNTPAKLWISETPDNQITYNTI
jgi:hypothetical protein